MCLSVGCFHRALATVRVGVSIQISMLDVLDRCVFIELDGLTGLPTIITMTRDRNGGHYGK